MKSTNQISEILKKQGEHERRLSALEKLIEHGGEQYKTTAQSMNGVEKLSKKINIDKGKLLENFDLENNQLTLVKTMGENTKQKIQNVTLIVLLGYQCLLEVNEVSAKEIRRNLAENMLPGDNFGTYINELSPSLIRRKGKLKSSKTSYRLLPLGEARARELIKLLCGA